MSAFDKRTRQSSSVLTQIGDDVPPHSKTMWFIPYASPQQRDFSLRKPAEPNKSSQYKHPCHASMSHAAATYTVRLQSCTVAARNAQNRATNPSAAVDALVQLELLPYQRPNIVHIGEAFEEREKFKQLRICGILEP
eukprot:scaffold3752_cov117-Isochrysis_galbana.AAC.2